MKKRKRRHTESEKQSALASLRANDGGIKKTSEQTGINASTLAAWNEGRNISKPIFIEHVRERIKPAIERLAPFLAEIDARRAAQRLHAGEDSTDDVR